MGDFEKNKKSARPSGGIARSVPHNNDAERGVLACFFFDSNGVLFSRSRMEGLVAEWFFNPSHQKIYSAMFELYQKNISIEIISLITRLKANDDLDSVGGTPYLSQVAVAVETTAHFWRWVNMIRGCFKSRRVLEIFTRGIESLYDGQDFDFEEQSKGLLSMVGEVSDLCLTQEDASLPERIDWVSEKNKNWWDGNEDNFERVFSWTIPELDKFLDPFKPDSEHRVITILGKGGSGKTALVRQIAWYALCKKFNVTVFTYEVSLEKYIETMASSVALINLREDPKVQRNKIVSKKRGEERYLNMQKNLTFLKGEAEKRLHVFDKNSDIDFVSSTCRSLKRKLGRLDMVIVDYLQLVKFSRIMTNRRGDEVIDAIMAELRSISADCGCAIFMMSGINSDGEAKGSQGVFQASDRYIVMSIPDKDDQGHDQTNGQREQVRVLIEQRKHKYGPTGKFYINFLKPYMRFFGLPPEGQRGRKSHDEEISEAQSF